MPVFSSNLTFEKVLELTRSQAQTISLLQQSSDAKDEALSLMEKQVKELTAQLEYLKRQLFGRKSERYHPDQLFLDSLMIEALEQAPAVEPEKIEQETTIAEHTRKRTSGGRGALPSHLEREGEIIDLPEEEKILPDGTERPCIGHEESERLAYTPGKFTVKVQRRLKYGSPTGAEENGVVIAPLPERLIPRCMADETLLVHLVYASTVTICRSTVWNRFSSVQMLLFHAKPCAAG